MRDWEPNERIEREETSKVEGENPSIGRIKGLSRVDLLMDTSHLS